MADNAIRDAALAYAGMGWAVLPLRPHGKTPMTRHGRNDCSTDPEVIRAWWERWPDANVGIATGAESGGLVVIDLDVDEDRGEDGCETLREWEVEHGELPETATALTGGGGVHILYIGAGDLANSANAGMGVDVRGRGGYIVAPPSIHPSGARYEWEYDPAETPAAAMSAPVEEFIEHVRPSAQPAPERAADGPTVAEGGRNDAVYRFACSMRSRNLGGQALLEAARAFNDANCAPPLPDREVVKICESAMGRPAGLSEEARALQEAAAARRAEDGDGTGAKTAKTGRRGRPDAAQVADTLMDEFGACVVDGIPAVVIDGRWAMGSAAVDRAAWMVDRRAGLGVLREVQHRILTLAPRKAQSDPRYVGFANCVVDIETGAELEWTDELVIPNIIPVEWDPAAVCPEVDAFLARLACGREDVVLNLHQVLGYSMYRSNEFGQAPVLVNPQGANGKSSFIKVARALVGPENATAIDVNDLGRRFQAEAAAGKLVILSDDTGAGFIEANSMAVVKKVITGDEIHTDVKNGKGYDFIPRATLVISANRLPRMQDNSGGTMRRWFPIPFDAHFAKGEPGFDPRAVAKVTTPEALRRVAVLAMSGLAVMRAEDGFTPNHASEQMIQEIELDNSTVAQFMDEEGIDAAWLDGRPTEEVYLRYEKWAEDAGVQHPLGRRSVTRELSERGNVRNVATRRKTATGEFVGVRVFKAGNVPNDAKKTG